MDLAKLSQLCVSELDDMVDLKGVLDEEELEIANKLYELYNHAPIWEMPYTLQMDDVIDYRCLIFLTEINKIWTDHMQETFYSMWDNDELDGAVMDSYYEVISKCLNKEMADRLWDKSEKALNDFVNKGIIYEL